MAPAPIAPFTHQLFPLMNNVPIPSHTTASEGRSRLTAVHVASHCPAVHVSEAAQLPHVFTAPQSSVKLPQVIPSVAHVCVCGGSGPGQPGRADGGLVGCGPAYGPAVRGRAQSHPLCVRCWGGTLAQSTTLGECADGLGRGRHKSWGVLLSGRAAISRPLMSERH